VGGHSYDTTEFYQMLGVLEDFITGMPPKDSSVYLNLVRRGMPMLFLHHAICTFQEWKGYGELVGGKYLVEGFGNDPSEPADYKHDLDLWTR